ncbi:flagellar protein FlgN [Tropicibacter oceani]|uniref:Flagellar protein FlgN n=1 Tax=Tropicibacter oceani TaxID=3058420 RepID=A0ABY8QJ55_9RHOB|nr:flagellar protein FlgN [Tropicibacter oceani]WGW04672.1 flagellar protein FlgN [Tropicibacter oceani]
MTNDTDLIRLEELIAAERQALLEGDFDRIADLMEEKQDLAFGLAKTTNDETKVAPLRDGLRRNQELFDHALAGLRNVANRLNHLNHLRKTLDTYDEKGRRTPLSTPAENKLERRA